MLSSGPSLPLFKPRSIGIATGPYVDSFPFTTKRKQQHDLLTFEPHVTGKNGLTNLCLYRNPLGTNHADQGDWEKLKIATLRNPAPALAYADISLNGYNDVIIADDYGTPEKVNPLGGRVSWLENLGSGTGEWVRREIGRFPGTHTLKAGRFTNTYSLQILAIPLTLPQNETRTQLVTAEFPSPLIVYTQPQNIASGRPWLSSVAFSATFCLVSDASVVHPPSNMSGLLDKVLLASKEGITLVWWEMERWHARSLSPGLVRNPSVTIKTGAGLVRVAKVAKDDAGYVVSAEPLQGPILSLYVKSLSVDSEGVELQHPQWSKRVLDDFRARDGIIMQIQCADLDGDGIDEVIALVKVKEGSIPCGDLEGLWYYKVVNLVKGEFEKLKIADGDIASVAAGDFQCRGKTDLITISQHLTSDLKLPHTHGLTLLSITFNHPIIHASLICPDSTTTLLLSTPRPSIANAAFELPLFRLFGVTFSLVVLPPQELFALTRSPGERNGVKVLYGQVTWAKPSGKTTIIGRAMPRAFSQSGVTGRPMVLDGQASGVTASTQGAVFLRLRAATRHGVGEVADPLETHNLIPAPYPSYVRGKQFEWDAVLAAKECSHIQIFTLEAFRIQFIDTPDDPDFAHVHFTACRGPASSHAALPLPTLIPAPSPPPYSDSQVSVCQVRACIVNGSGNGGIYVEHARLHKNHNTESRVCGEQGGLQLMWAVPSLTEVAPMWYVGDSGAPIQEDGNVLYPSVYGWLSDVSPLQNGQHSSRTKTRAMGDTNIGEVKERKSFDVWMDVDFPPFNLELTEADAGGKTRRPWVRLSVACFALALVLCLLYHCGFIANPRLLLGLAN